METTFNTEFVDTEIEKQPYLDPLARVTLQLWFEVNDSIEPIFEDRNDWEKREAILQRKEDNNSDKHVLYIPENLTLFEMGDIVTAVDKDTFADKTELSSQGGEKIKKLAGIFKKAGVYIDENISSVTEGKDIAEELSKKFFNYGLSLESKTNIKNEPIQPTVLNEYEKRELDKWLIGNERYYKVMSRLGPNPSQEDIDTEREKHFNGYFKALSRKGSEGKDEKPWKRSLGPIAKIHEKTKDGIKREVSQPNTEIYRSIYERGREMLKKEVSIPKEMLLNSIFGNEPKKLYEKLNIPKLKEELEHVKSQGDIEEISKKEFEIAKNIREHINRYEYRSGANNPSEIVKDNYLNCLGSTLLGSSILDEVGIKHLYVFPPRHVMTFLLTTNGKLYWQDFTPGYSFVNGMEITDNMFEGNPDILTLAKKPNTFNVVDKWDQENYLISSSPDAMMAALIHNTGKKHGNLKRYEEAEKIFRKGIEINPNDYYSYKYLGTTLKILKRYEEAEEIFRKGIEINPNDSDFYYYLGTTLNILKRYEEAEVILRKGIEINPNNSDFYYHLAITLENLKRYEEAEKIFRKGIEINPNDSDLYYSLALNLFLGKKYRDAFKIFKKGRNLSQNIK